LAEGPTVALLAERLGFDEFALSFDGVLHGSQLLIPALLGCARQPAEQEESYCNLQLPKLE